MFWYKTLYRNGNRVNRAESCSFKAHRAIFPDGDCQFLYQTCTVCYTYCTQQFCTPESQWYYLSGSIHVGAKSMENDRTKLVQRQKENTEYRHKSLYPN